MPINTVNSSFWIFLVLTILVKNSVTQDYTKLVPPSLQNCCSVNKWPDRKCMLNAAFGLPDGKFIQIIGDEVIEAKRVSKKGLPELEPSSYKKITTLKLTAGIPVEYAISFKEGTDTKVIIKQKDYFTYNAAMAQQGTSETSCKNSPLCGKDTGLSSAVTLNDQSVVAFYGTPNSETFDYKVFDPKEMEINSTLGLKGNVTASGIYKVGAGGAQKGVYFTANNAACLFEVPGQTTSMGIPLQEFGYRPFWCLDASMFLGCPPDLCWGHHLDGFFISERTKSGEARSINIVRGAYILMEDYAVGDKDIEAREGLIVEQGWRVLGEPVGGESPQYIPKYIDKTVTYILKGDEVLEFDMKPFLRGPTRRKISEVFPGIEATSNFDTMFFTNGTNQMFLFKENAFWIFDINTATNPPSWKNGGGKKYVGNHFHGFPKSLGAVYPFKDLAYVTSGNWYFKVKMNNDWSTDNKQTSHTPTLMFGHNKGSYGHISGFFKHESGCPGLRDTDEEIVKKMSEFTLTALPRRKNPWTTPPPITPPPITTIPPTKKSSTKKPSTQKPTKTTKTTTEKTTTAKLTTEKPTTEKPTKTSKTTTNKPGATTGPTAVSSTSSDTPVISDTGSTLAPGQTNSGTAQNSTTLVPTKTESNKVFLITGIIGILLLLALIGGGVFTYLKMNKSKTTSARNTPAAIARAKVTGVTRSARLGAERPMAMLAKPSAKR